MFRNIFLLCLWLPCAAQDIHLQDWTPLSEENKKIPATGTVFLDKPCVKLDGHAVAAIWNKKAR
jgi:hypothetical protein